MDETTYSFGYWVQRRRKALDLSRVGLAARVNCSPETIKKIERDERRPSEKVAELLADALALSHHERTFFLQMALKQRPADSLPITTEPVHGLPFALHDNLPTVPTPCIGRENEKAEICARLSDPGCQLLTIAGPGGCGKSRLAIEVARSLINAYRHGACFVPLAGVESAASLPAAIATSLDLHHNGGGSIPQSKFIGYLRDKQILLVLDNYEQLLPETTLLMEILHHSSSVKILVTSRQRLRLNSEWVYSLEGLSVPPPGPVADGSDYSSMRLFRESARHGKPDFALDKHQADAVAQICRDVAGMPLAIQLASAWIPVLDPVRIAEEIRRGLDFLEADLSDLPKRQRSMRAVFDSMWKLLNEEEQKAMKMLAVFSGGFTLAVAHEIFDLPVKRILKLVNSYWIQPETGERFNLHELVRQYAQEKVQLDNELVSFVYERHSAHFCGLLHRFEPYWYTAREDDALGGIETEYKNIDAAWKWALKQQRLDLVLCAATSLARYYNQSMRFTEEKAAMEAALRCMDSCHNKQGMDRRTLQLAQARARISLIGMQPTKDEMRKEIRNIHGLLDQLEMAGPGFPAQQKDTGEGLRNEAVDTRYEKAQILHWEGHLLMGEDDGRAFDLLGEVAAIYRELGNDVLLARTILSIGEYHASGGDIHQAFQNINHALSISIKTGYPRLAAEVYMLLGLLNWHSGNFEEAEHFGQLALLEYRKLGFRYDDGFALIHISQTLLTAGKFSEALLYAMNSLNVFTELGTGPNHQNASKIMIAQILLHQGNYEKVDPLVWKGLYDLNTLQDHRVKGMIFDTAGMQMLLKQQTEQAVELFEMSRQMYQKIKFAIMTGIPEANLVYAFLAAHDVNEARRHLTQCLIEAIAIDSYPFAIHALPALALFYAEQGSAARAVEVYTLALQHPYISESKWFDDIAGKRIQSLTDQLPRETAQAAKMCGRSLAVWPVVKEWVRESVPDLQGR